MPFQSEAQRRYLWARHPDIAQRWADEMKHAGQSQKGLPYKKGGHMAKKRIRFSDVAAEMKGGASVRHATRKAHGKHPAAPDGSPAMPIDRNQLATDQTAPAGVMRHGRKGGKANSEHMKKALELLMRSRKKGAGRARQKA